MDKDKLTVLFIRNDSYVRRYRLRPFWLKFLVLVVLLLSVLSVIAVSIGITSWKKYSDINAEVYDLQEELADKEAKLNRLQTLEKFLRIKKPKEYDELAKLQSYAREGEELDVNVLLKRQELFEKTDLHRVSVVDVHVKQIGSSRYKISYDIYNLDPPQALEGRVYMWFITRQYEKIPLNLDGRATYFRIQNYKHAEDTVSVPREIKEDQILALRVQVKDESGKVLLNETHQYKNVLSLYGLPYGLGGY